VATQVDHRLTHAFEQLEAIEADPTLDPPAGGSSDHLALRAVEAELRAIRDEARARLDDAESFGQ